MKIIFWILIWTISILGIGYFAYEDVHAKLQTKTIQNIKLKLQEHKIQDTLKISFLNINNNFQEYIADYFLQEKTIILKGKIDSKELLDQVTNLVLSEYLVDNVIREDVYIDKNKNISEQFIFQKTVNKPKKVAHTNNTEELTNGMERFKQQLKDQKVSEKNNIDMFFDSQMDDVKDMKTQNNNVNKPTITDTMNTKDVPKEETIDLFTNKEKKIVVMKKNKLNITACQNSITEIMIQNAIEFAYKKTTLKNNKSETIDSILVQLKKCDLGEIQHIEVGGYTDSIGSDRYNQKLSKKRANSVKKYIIKQGLSSSFIKAIGYGEQNPIATNKTKTGQAKNRRIEIILKDKR